MTETRYFDTFPRLTASFGPAPRIAIYDRALTGKNRIPGLSSWLDQFDLVIPVAAGESLKTLGQLDKTLVQILSKPQAWPRATSQIIAIGGGSVGDFGGFLASVFQRGVQLIHVPTTWLAAMDSAHGGKTALNLGGIKNLIGTFYLAKETWVISAFFKHQIPQRAVEAAGEAAKMALLTPRLWANAKGSLDSKKLWELLPELIAAKNRIVASDPFEKLGKRVTLNLGHTLGHALELDFEIPHGTAVGIGLRFSSWVSWCEGWLSARDFFEIERGLATDWLIPVGFSSISKRKRKRFPTRQRLKKLMLRDKKVLSERSLSFVGLRGIGRPHVFELPIEKILDYAASFAD